MIKALVVAPYEGLFEIMKDIDNEVNDFELQTELGNLYEGVEIARGAENRGFNVIISRGGTASMIQAVVSIPVINIQVTGYDVLRILTLVKGFPGKAAIVGFPNITQGATTISNLLDLNIKTITISNDIEVEDRLNYLKKLGYEVVIGDVVTVQTAKKLGLNGVLITSGKEAILEALEEARRVYRLFSRLHQDVSLYEFVLNSDERPIAIINRDERIIYSNKRFQKDVQNGELENSPYVKDFVKKAFEIQKKQTKRLYLDNQLWKLTIVPSEGYVLLYFEAVFEQDEKNEEQTNGLLPIEIKTSVPYAPITGKSEAIQKVLQQVHRYSRMQEPLWIRGEEGNGKELIAQSIYLERKKNNEPFIIIHCDMMKEKHWIKLTNEDFFQKNYDSIIYLKRVDQLDLSIQKEFYHLLKKNNKLPLWIVSSREDIEQKVIEGRFDRDFYYTLARLIISIPPLRERKKDIESLVHVFISDYHTKYGKQVVGIRQDALEELKTYEWPGNVDEIKQVIEQLVLNSQSYYLEKKEIEEVITSLKQAQHKKEEAGGFLDLSGTLEEIEKQVLIKILEEEDMNQSKAAKRLGINRSTLWRKLK